MLGAQRGTNVGWEVNGERVFSAGLSVVKHGLHFSYWVGYISRPVCQILRIKEGTLSVVCIPWLHVRYLCTAGKVVISVYTVLHSFMNCLLPLHPDCDCLCRPLVITQDVKLL